MALAFPSGTQWDTLVGLGNPSGTGSGIPWWDWDTLLRLGHWHKDISAALGYLGGTGTPQWD